MLPASQFLPQACLRRLHPLRATALAAALLACAQPGDARAQEATPPLAQATTPPPGNADVPVAFEADEVAYQEDSEVVTVKGNVVLRREDQSLRADTVTWDRKSGEIIASGNVRMVDKDGNQLFTDRMLLTDEFRTGAMENLLLALREGGRLAATGGQRQEDGTVLLDRATYSGCAVEDEHGCPRNPSWRVISRKVIYDEESRQVSFKGARLEMFGALQLPLPGLKLTTDGRAISGFQIPDFRISPSNGMEISQAYYLRLAENRDLTATGYFYTDVPPMVSAQYRALTERGAYQITGYATHSRKVDIFGTAPGTEKAFRGYLAGNGRLQLSPHWSVTGSVRRASDRTFLRRYDISRDDRLRSMVDIERVSNRTYFSLAGWATQTMRVAERQGQVPVALPAIDFRHRLARPVLGGRVEFQANSLAIMRTSGQETQRAFAGARWDLRRITGMGQEMTLTALVRGDLYHSDENDLTTTEIYRGRPGWQARGVATAALDVKWPLVGAIMGGTQAFVPRLQLAATPSIRNLAVPNEDARAIDLEDSNLFALNRFPGHDRIEDGMRFTYGFDWQFERPRWRVKTTVGQSLRLTREPTLLPNGTGLSSRTSDIVGRTEVRYRDFVNLVHRFRIDKDSLAIRRNEFDATIGDHRTYAEIGYVKLNRDIAAGLEDLRDREELRVAGRVAFARYWSLFGSAVVNLTNRAEDPLQKSDGFQPLRTRVGAAYQDDCLEIAVTWRRNYIATGDAKKGNSFQVHFALRNLGFR